MRILHKCGNTTSFWSDPWPPWGTFKPEPSRAQKETCTSKGARVAEIIQENNQRIAYGRGCMTKSYNSDVLAEA